MAPNQYPRRTLIVMVGLLILLVAADLLLTIRLFDQSEQMCRRAEAQDTLPCPAIPTQFVLDEPLCADKLLRAMNVTSVRILPRGSSVLQMDEEMNE